MYTLSWINFTIAALFFICYAYQFFYIPLVWIRKNKEKKLDDKDVSLHDFAVLICARNESVVIADLIASIQAQTYPQDRITIFVMADNCTDNTAETARNAGAVVYERQNKEFVGKGYALDALIQHIHEDYPDGFDAYMVFDADNVLSKDYIANMNRKFCEGHDLITSYRNTKNYGSNWISMGYALWFIRESRYANHARGLLKTSCAISGTGFLFSRKIIEELEYRWPFHMLTEDLEFTAYQVTKGRKIAFCADAELYDEQPVKFGQSWRQRMRWTRGYMQVIRGYSGKLFKGMFKGSFSCYDMAMNIMPAFILSALSVFCNIGFGIWGAVIGDDIMIAIKSIGETLINLCAMLMVVGGIAVITEWKHILASNFKKILSIFAFPLFMATYIPIGISSLFIKTKWKPIEHTMSVSKLSGEKDGISKKI